LLYIVDALSPTMSSVETRVPGVRRVEIRPPSLRTETIGVLWLAAAIIAAAGVCLVRPAQTNSRANPAERNLLPYQVLVQDVPTGEQRVFRELQEGLLEAERARSAAGKWPDPSALAADGVPPFAPDPTAGDAACRWRMLTQGVFINYLGIPPNPGAPAWLLVIREPELGSAPDLAPNDEEHHRLADGTVLHVSVWNVPESSRTTGGLVAVQRPELEGWRQLRVGPSAASPVVNQ
jgi:hypothetical protein